MIYKLVEGNAKKGRWFVMEQASKTRNEYKIGPVQGKNNAVKLQKHLNNGGGFDGFTPDFFKVDIKT